MVRSHPQKRAGFSETSATIRPIPFDPFPAGGEFGAFALKFGLPDAAAARKERVADYGVYEKVTEISCEIVQEARPHGSVPDKSLQVALIGLQAERQFSERKSLMFR